MQATLRVYGTNGLSVNGNSYTKNQQIVLHNGDLIVICERLFKWESAKELTIQLDVSRFIRQQRCTLANQSGLTLFRTWIVQSPASARHRPLRYSLINAAAISCTPAKPKPTPSQTLSIPPPASSSLFSTLLSPLRAATSVLSPTPALDSQSAEDDASTEDLMTWDEPAEEAGGDLIAWEEVDEEDEELEDELAELQVEEHCVPATPALNQRARVLRLPGSERRAGGTPATPGTKASRRMSMRMTIVPSDRVNGWVRERDLQRAEAEAEAARESHEDDEQEEHEAEAESSDEDQQTSPSRQLHTHLAPAWPSKLGASPSLRSVSPSGRPSMTSRRISHLLLTPAQALAQEAAEAAGLAPAEESSSDSSEDEYDYEQEHDYNQPIQASESEGDISIGYPFPLVEAEVESDTPDEVDQDVDEDRVVPVSEVDSSPARTPRHSHNRRLSLREKVLIRSAIKATTPPLEAPVATPTPEVEVDTASVDDVEMTDVEMEESPSSSEKEEEVADEAGEVAGHVADEACFSSEPATPVRAQDVPLPTSIKFGARNPDQLTLSPRHRDSIELVRARNATSSNPSPSSQLDTQPIRWAPDTPSQRSPGTDHSAPAPLSSESDEDGEPTDENVAPEEQAVPGPVADRTTLILGPAVDPIPRPATSTPLATLFAGPSTPLGSAKKRSIFTSRAAASSSMQQHQSAARNFFAPALDSPAEFLIPLKTPRSVPLPSTPAGQTNTWIFSRDAPTPQTPTTPEQAATLAQRQAERAFQSEMRSPVNGHRTMATPRSAMKTGVLKGRRKSIRGFLEPMISPRKSVVFNEQLFVKEVQDIRDEKLHWDPEYDQDEDDHVLGSTSPAGDTLAPIPAPPPSPALFTSAQPMMLTPVKAPQFASYRPSPCLSVPSSEVRKAQRVPTDTPSDSVRKAVQEVASLSASPAVGTPARRARRVQTPTRAAAGTPTIAAADRSGALPGTPVARVVGRTIASTQTPPLSATAVAGGQTMSAKRAQIASLRKAGRVSVEGAVIKSAVAAGRTGDLRERLAAVRRVSMPSVEARAVETPIKVKAAEEAELATPEQVAALLGVRPTPTPRVASELRKEVEHAEETEIGTPEESASAIETEDEPTAVVALPVEAAQEGDEVEQVRERVAKVSIKEPAPPPVKKLSAVLPVARPVVHVDEKVIEVVEPAPRPAPAPTRRTTRKPAAAASSIPTRATRATRTTRATSAEADVEPEAEEAPAKPAPKARKAAASTAAKKADPKDKDEAKPAPAPRARSKSVSKKAAPVVIREDTPPLPNVEAEVKAAPTRASRRVLAAANAEEAPVAAPAKTAAKSGIRAPRVTAKKAAVAKEAEEGKEENLAAGPKKATRARKVAEPVAAKAQAPVAGGRALRSRG